MKKAVQRLIALLLCVTFLCSLAACGGSGGQSSSKGDLVHVHQVWKGLACGQHIQFVIVFRAADTDYFPINIRQPIGLHGVL